jgi:uncharacterized membrane protein YjfL (UPF0719 family)
MDFTAHLDQLLWTLIYSVLGMGVFGLSFFLITRLSPFSVRHEIEVDQNTSLAIIIGSVNVGLAIIIAAAIAG